MDVGEIGLDGRRGSPELDVLAGGPCQLDATNIKVVNASNYAQLGQDDYGRLIRFEGVKIRYAKCGWSKHREKPTP